MKKIFLLLAFTGIVGAASANTIMIAHKATSIVCGDDKKGDDKKKCDKKKSCCKKGEAGKTCTKGKTEEKAVTPEPKK